MHRNTEESAMPRWPILMLICLCSCSTTRTSYEMQPDHSYRIFASGGGSQPKRSAQGVARARAQQLCPGGYDTKTEFEDDAEETLIVMCK